MVKNTVNDMALKVYNTISGKKEDFTPVSEGKVKLYVCGVTVYDHCHIGHARSAIVFDTIFRYLRTKGYDVTYVRNFTDIDDKIIRRSREENMPWQEVGQKYIASFYEDMDALGIMRPTHEPRATDHIGDMIALVDALIKKGHAYSVGGDVYFSVDSYRNYGELSKRPLEELMSGARVEVDEKKKNPLDFALWKASKEGEPSWDAPFGKGRPGWHIECSAMSTLFLGNPFDIHGGGKDLVFPHHENEKAQTEAATGGKFVNYWVHNGFVNIDREKMSKSIGNTLSIKEFLKEYHPEVLRLFYLSNHYRSPVDYSSQSIDDANTALQRLYYTRQRALDVQKGKSFEARSFGEAEEISKKFIEAMDDDFNTALALSYIFELSKEINRMVDEKGASAIPLIASANQMFESLAGTLGLLEDNLESFENQAKIRHLARMGLDASFVENAINDRIEARKNKDFQKADEIRNMLVEKGIMLLDTPKGTQWRIKTSVS
ncbi:MAG: cysS [Deltaproteobacteria bacterium]|nr:cysS [Deltaproteobacteria bacterium]